MVVFVLFDLEVGAPTCEFSLAEQKEVIGIVGSVEYILEVPVEIVEPYSSGLCHAVQVVREPVSVGFDGR